MEHGHRTQQLGDWFVWAWPAFIVSLYVVKLWGHMLSGRSYWDSASAVAMRRWFGGLLWLLPVGPVIGALTGVNGGAA